jgi:hypothetical protein
MSLATRVVRPQIINDYVYLFCAIFDVVVKCNVDEILPPPRFRSESLGRLIGPSLGKSLDQNPDTGKCVAQNPTRRFARQASLRINARKISR